jgi:purine nucleosidase
LAHFFLDCNSTAIESARRQSGTNRLELPDPTAMAVAIEKDRVVTRSSRHYVEVEAESPLTRGMSVVDSLDVTGSPANVEVINAIDTDRFKQMLSEAARG